MSALDYRRSPITGSSPDALEAFERALAAFQCWHVGADAQVAQAVAEAPRFVMAHVLQCWLALCSREPSAADVARPLHARARELPANERERMHLAAIEALIADDYDRSRAILEALLTCEPRDVLALQVAHALDYLAGDTVQMHDRVARVLHAWSPAVPGYHAVLAMLAFGMEETGAYEEAEATALRVVEMNPRDARAHHVLAHVYEMTAQPAAGVRWMAERLPLWAVGTTVATHCWWHLALFHLEEGRVPHVLALYDRRLRAGRSSAVADLIDASSLLWRIDLGGSDTGERWAELAARWTPHADDGFCTFTDVHAMLAFAGARDWRLAEQQLQALERRQSSPTRHGRMTRLVGLPACRALAAFARGDHVSAIEGLGQVTALAPRLGGSHAQRDVLHLTLRAAIDAVRARRPLSRRAA